MKGTHVCVLFGCVMLLSLTACGAHVSNAPSVMGMPVDSLTKSHVIDLTHAFSTTIPIPDGLPQPEVKEIYGGAIQIFTHAGQFGTHLDAPGHFHKGIRLVDGIPARDFLVFVGVPKGERATGFPVRVLAVVK